MICYLVLHYNNYTVTRQCIISLLDISEKEDKIIVIDNGSQNQSGFQIEEEYANNSQVEIYHMKENLGFSRGNNFGYCIARKYSPEFIVNINNDIIINQKDFGQRLRRLFDETAFFVYGPDVYIDRTGEHQSPYRKGILSIEEAEKEIERCKQELRNIDKVARRIQRNTFFKLLVPRVVREKRNARRIEEMQRIKQKKGLDYRNRHEEVCICGCCIIVSKLFIDKNDKLYFPETDFYNEEEILLYQCMKNNMKLLYDPICQVHHMQGASVKEAYKSIKKRIKFVNENMIRAKQIYIDLLRDEEQSE